MEPIRAFLVRTHEVSDFGALVLFLPEQLGETGSEQGRPQRAFFVSCANDRLHHRPQKGKERPSKLFTFSLVLFLFLSPSPPPHVCEHTRTGTRAHACRGQRTPSAAGPWLLFRFLETDSPSWLGLLTHRLCLPLPPQHWDYTWEGVLPLLVFCFELRNWTRAMLLRRAQLPAYHFPRPCEYQRSFLRYLQLLLFLWGLISISQIPIQFCLQTNQYAHTQEKLLKSSFELRMPLASCKESQKWKNL